MNYSKLYTNLIKSRKLLNRKKHEGIYYEKHHIIPKSCGGTNEKSNLILLTPKEHFVAHLLLTKIYVGKEKQKMFFALWRLANTKKYKIISANQYNNIKLSISRELSEKKTGILLSENHKKNIRLNAKPHNKGIKGVVFASEETKAKMSKARKERKISEDTKRKLKDIWLKKTKEDILNRNSKILKTKEENNTLKHSQLTKDKIKKTMKRWHEENISPLKGRKRPDYLKDLYQNRIRINNGINQKNIKNDELENWLILGWTVGSLKHKRQ